MDKKNKLSAAYFYLNSLTARMVEIFEGGNYLEVELRITNESLIFN